MFFDKIIEMFPPEHWNFVRFIFYFISYAIFSVLLLIFKNRFCRQKTNSILLRILQLFVKSICIPLIIFCLVSILANENNFFLMYTDEYIVFIVKKFKDISFTWLSWLCFVNVIRNIQEIISNTRSDESKIKLLNISINIVKCFSYVVLLLMILKIFGFNIRVIIEKAGGSTAIITGIFIFLYKSQFSNILTGFTLLLNKNFRVGKRMIFPEKKISGVVMSIRLNTTTILTDEQKVVVFPNSFLSDTPYYNLSEFKNSLISVQVYIDHKSYDKINDVIVCINKSIKENTIVNKNLRVSVFVNEINLNGALVLQAEYFVKSVDSEKIKYEKQWLLLKILEACTKNDCSIYEKYK